MLLEKINSTDPTIKFTADWFYSSVNFLDVNFILKGGKIISDFYVKPTSTHNATHTIAKKVSLTVKICTLIKSVLILPPSIRDVTN